MPGSLARVLICVGIGQVRDPAAIGRPEKGRDVVILMREQARCATRAIDQLQRPVAFQPAD